MSNVVVLPGDFIGPEVIESAIEVLRHVAPDLHYTHYAFGLAGIEKYGLPLAPEALAAAQKADESGRHYCFLHLRPCHQTRDAGGE